MVGVGCGPLASESSADGEGESETGFPEQLEGLTVDSVRHRHQCIDGCESYYSSDRVELNLTAEAASTVVVELHDWTTGDRTLRERPDTAEHLEVELEAGAPTRVEFSDSRDGYCTMDEWDKPLRVLVVIDGVALELEGRSTASYGWDC